MGLTIIIIIVNYSLSQSTKTEHVFDHVIDHVIHTLQLIILHDESGRVG